MRSKEEAHDYRYFPEPDLPPLVVDAARVERVRSELPELPDARRRRFVAEYGLPGDDAVQLTQSRGARPSTSRQAVAAGAAAEGGRATGCMGDARAKMNERAPTTSARSRDRAARSGSRGLIALVEQGTISGSIAKDVFEKMFASGRAADEIVRRRRAGADRRRVAARRARSPTCSRSNADAVAQYRGGKATTFGFLVGQVMKAAAGKANPKRVNELLKKALDVGQAGRAGYGGNGWPC